MQCLLLVSHFKLGRVSKMKKKAEKEERKMQKGGE